MRELQPLLWGLVIFHFRIINVPKLSIINFNERNIILNPSDVKIVTFNGYLDIILNYYNYYIILNYYN